MLSPASLIDCIAAWLESNPHVVVGHEIKKINGERFDVCFRKTDKLVGIIVFNKYVRAQSSNPSSTDWSNMHVWAVDIWSTSNKLPTHLIGVGVINDDIVEFDDNNIDLTDPDAVSQNQLSHIMSASNPQFFSWVRDWLRTIILNRANMTNNYGMD